MRRTIKENIPNDIFFLIALRNGVWTGPSPPYGAPKAHAPEAPSSILRTNRWRTGGIFGKVSGSHNTVRSSPHTISM